MSSSRRGRVGVISVLLVVVAIAVIAETNPGVKGWIGEHIISPIRSFFGRLFGGGEKTEGEGYLPIERPIRELADAVNARNADAAYGLLSVGIRAEHPKPELEEFMVRCETSDFEITHVEALEAEVWENVANLEVAIAYTLEGVLSSHDEYIRLALEGEEWRIDEWVEEFLPV